jgi:hypothetical protein
MIVNDYVINPQILMGKRVRLTEQMNDPFPIEVGSEGEVYNVGYDVVNVKWDNGRNLGLVLGEDKFEIKVDYLNRKDGNMCSSIITIPMNNISDFITELKKLEREYKSYKVVDDMCRELNKEMYNK